MPDENIFNLSTENVSESSASTVARAHAESHKFTWTILQFESISRNFIDTQCAKNLKYSGAIQSSQFTTGIFDDVKTYWVLLLYPYKSTPLNTFIGIQLHMQEPRNRVHEVGFTISLLDAAGESVNSKTIEKCSFKTGDCKGWMKFISRKKLLRKKSVYLGHDRLTVRCEVIVKYQFTLKTLDPLQTRDLKSQHTNEFLRDIKSLLETEKCSDVTLRCGEEEFRCHKSVLYARSPVFASMFDKDVRSTTSVTTESGALSVNGVRAGKSVMFESGDASKKGVTPTSNKNFATSAKEAISGKCKTTKDNSITTNGVTTTNEVTTKNGVTTVSGVTTFKGATTKVSDTTISKSAFLKNSVTSCSGAATEKDTTSENFVDIQDVEAPAMKHLLNYIYSADVCELPRADCLNLYLAADKFCVTGLRLYCISVLIKDMTVDSVCSLAELADRHEDAELFSEVKMFVNLHTSDVVTSNQWIDLMERNSVLAARLLRM